MSQDIYNLLSGFKNLREFQEFLEEAAAGEQISNGMTGKMTPDSKKQKQQVVSKEVTKGANGSSSEKHYDYIDTDAEDQEDAPEAPPPPPPGAQIGRKVIKKEQSPETLKINLSGKKEKFNKKPSITIRAK